MSIHIHQTTLRHIPSSHRPRTITRPTYREMHLNIKYHLNTSRGRINPTQQNHDAKQPAGMSTRQLVFGFPATPRLPPALSCSAVGRRACRLGVGGYVCSTTALPAPPPPRRAKPASAQPLLVNKDAAERAQRQWRWCVPPIGANQASLPAAGSRQANHRDQIQIRDRTDSQTPMII